VSTFRGSAAAPDPFRNVGLNAGPVINLRGPGGAKQLPLRQPGSYVGELGGGSPSIPGVPAANPAFLSPGAYSLDNGSGGPDVGGFTSQITISGSLTWTNRDQVNTLVRANGQLVTWTGAPANSEVYITGSSVRTNPQVGASFVCIAPGSAGQFTIPAAVLLQLPATEGATPTAALSVGATSNAVRFNASGLDIGVLTHSASSTKTVSMQ
jgi:hypothetical protein